jgi:monovalent cation:proton antiporter-2 (CPA2) family protein
MTDGFLFQAVIYLTAAVVCVPLAKRLGLSSVLGYLLAGIVIGPFVLGFIGEEGEDIMHFAEFGVVMMLFLIGLELEPAKFWRMRKIIVGMGGMQVLFTVVAFMLVGLAVGLKWPAALTIGLAVSMSSTAIVLQTLKEKGLMGSASGQSSFSVLLFQDIAVIPMLALMPIMAVSASTHTTGGHDKATIFDGLPAGVQTLAVLLAVVVIVLSGRYLIVPLLRIIAKTHLRELFAAGALLIVIAIAYLMQLVGLSPALGAFLGGVVLANSEFRHELESDLEPFKGLLLGLFFIAVGASINFYLISAQPWTVAAGVIAVILVKTFVMLGIGGLFKMSTDQNILFSTGLSQIGEFAFVLLAFAAQLGIITSDISGILLAVTALTMTVSPLINIATERLVLPRIGTIEEPQREMDAINESNAVILVGFAHFGNTIGRFLRAHGVQATILDNDSDRVDLLRKMGFKVYYGDATRADLLESAGAANAKILVSAIDSPEINMRLVETAQKHFPHLQLMIRAENRTDAYELLDMGVNDIYRESLDTSIRMAADVLKRLGFRSYAVTRSAQNFLKYDESSLRKLAADRHNNKEYIVRVKDEMSQQEQLLSEDLNAILSSNDHAWDSEHMRSVINPKEGRAG